MNRRQLLLSGIAAAVCAPAIARALATEYALSYSYWTEVGGALNHAVTPWLPTGATIHNVRVFRKALSADQIRILYTDPYGDHLLGGATMAEDLET